MAEQAAPAPKSVEARAVRSGGAAGGVTELGKFKLGEWFGNAKNEIKARIGLSKAEKQIEGNTKASEKIKKLGTKIISGVDGIGNMAESASRRAEQKAYNKSAKATEYEQKLAELRNKPLEVAKKAGEYALANVTLEMHDLPGNVGPKKGNIFEKVGDEAVRLGDATKERFYKWRSEVDNKQAESDLTWAVKYGDAASAIHVLADNFDIIIGDNGRATELTADKGIATEASTNAEAAARESATQFNKVITEGASIGKAGIPLVEQVDVSDAAKQKAILKNLQEAVTKTGTQ